MAKMIVGLLVVLMLTACGGTAATSSQTAAGGDTAGTAANAAASTAAYSTATDTDGVEAQAAPASGVSGEQNQGAANAQAPRERLVIKTATVQLLVAKVEDAEAQVRRLADTRNGFVLSSQASGSENERRATVTIKIPSNRFDEVLTELGKVALKVDSQDVQGQDVTDEFVDLESRLRNLRAVETRLLQFLSEANRVEDLLQINQQLSDTQGQIEETQGRMTYLKESASLSTITVSLYANVVVSVVPDEGWSPGTTARSALKTLIVFGQGLADIAIVFAVWAPLWLPVVFAVLWMRRRVQRQSRPTSQPTQP